MDGGAHWGSPQLPVAGVLGDHLPNQTALNEQEQQLQAQDGRVYAAIVPLSSWVSGNSFGGRLVVSADGGATWRLCDAALHARGQVIYDVAPAPTGASIYAVTQSVNAPSPESSTPAPLQLWRSDDTGAHWTLLGAPPRNSETAM
jgi:hypothetical protein